MRHPDPLRRACPLGLSASYERHSLTLAVRMDAERWSTDRRLFDVAG